MVQVSRLCSGGSLAEQTVTVEDDQRAYSNPLTTSKAKYIEHYSLVGDVFYCARVEKISDVTEA
jgi:hypothetical protein